MNGKQVFGMVIGLGGLALIIIHGGWLVGLGVFLMLWGNNIDHSRRGP